MCFVITAFVSDIKTLLLLQVVAWVSATDAGL